LCFFINFNVTLQSRQAATPGSINDLARNHSLRLRGTFPSFQVTDGHCSCRQVLAEGRAIDITDFIQELLMTDEIKNVRVGWTWVAGQNVQMKPDASEMRLSVQEFVSRNGAEELHPDVWYRLYDAKRNVEEGKRWL
jgi:hypothetical protein